MTPVQTAAVSAPPAAATHDVVLVHNRYQQPGGEDAVFEAERQLLADNGHTVRTVTEHNESIKTMGRASAAAATLWNRKLFHSIRRECRSRQRVVAHFHNTFPLISPAAYYGARAAGAAVVQTLHNYRLICPGATLFRDGHTCDACVGRAVPWAAVRYSCYRQDRLATAVTATMLTSHRALGTWGRAVTLYIALTEFARQQFIAGGLPANRVVVKPNFLPVDPGMGPHDGDYALFVGRITPEKGILTLLDAWEQIGSRHRLVIVGSGPLERIRTVPGVDWRGWQPTDHVLAVMKRASLLVFPSTWYEGFPITLLQAFATGLPVLVSGHGSIAEIVCDGCTGCHFRPGNAADLAAQASSLLNTPDRLTAMGLAARREFEQRYTATHNYALLRDIYRRALATH